MVLPQEATLMLEDLRDRLLHISRTKQISVIELLSHYILAGETEMLAAIRQNKSNTRPEDATSAVNEEAALAMIPHAPMDRRVSKFAGMSGSFRSFLGRDKQKRSSLISSKIPEINDIVSQSTYGIEIEAFVTKQSNEMHVQTPVKAAGEFVPFLNQQLNEECQFIFLDCAASKADRIYDRWKVTTDSSITSEDGRPLFGLEVVSAKLTGWSGMATSVLVAQAMLSYGCATNNSTALHVHVACQNHTPEQLKQLFMYIVHFEAIIDTFHSYPRRNDASKYCRSLTRSVTGMNTQASVRDDAPAALRTLSLIDVSHSAGVDNLIKRFNPKLGIKTNSCRNHKINATLLRGTNPGDPARRIEWRQHAGTCDGQEIVMWARFCVVFTHKAATAADAPLPVLATQESFWAFMQEPQLAQYYSMKCKALPPEPPGYHGAVREFDPTSTTTFRVRATAPAITGPMIL